MWLIIRTPTGLHCWDLPTPTEDLINAARVAVAMPVDDDWVDTGAYHVSLSSGRPVTGNPTVGTLAQLQAVPGGPVTAHTTARRRWAAARASAQAAATLTALDDTAFAAVVDDPVVKARIVARGP